MHTVAERSVFLPACRCPVHSMHTVANWNCWPVIMFDFCFKSRLLSTTELAIWPAKTAKKIHNKHCFNDNSLGGLVNPAWVHCELHSMWPPHSWWRPTKPSLSLPFPKSRWRVFLEQRLKRLIDYTFNKLYTERISRERVSFSLKIAGIHR